MTNGSGWTLQLLQEHLQDAVELELFTIPIYLTAWWSVKGDPNSAASIIKSVVMEEMLHLELACNTLNAVGGHPVLTGSSAPTYPENVPFHKPALMAYLRPVSLMQIGAFMTIELPTYLDPGHDTTTGPAPSYDTIGEFYDAIENGLQSVNQFPGDPALQVTGNFGAEDQQPVTDLASALAALNLIIEQGEGNEQTHLDPEGDPGHYWRFKEVLDAITSDPSWVSQNVLNMIPDPGPPGTYSPRSESLLTFFDACYSYLLQQLESGFNGNTGLIGTAIGNMFSMIGPAGQYLVQQTDDQLKMNLTPRFLYSQVTLSQLTDMFNNLSSADQSGLKSAGFNLPTS